jgi:hypothetical protein
MVYGKFPCCLVGGHLGSVPTGLKQLKSRRDSFGQLKILTVYLIYNQETILYGKESVTAP